MNSPQRPNFVLVCIAIVLVSFSFASEALYKLSGDSNTIQDRLNNDQVVKGQMKPRISTPAVTVSQQHIENRLTANGLASVAFQDISPLNPAEDIANVSEDVAVIDALNILERQLVTAPTDASKTALIKQNHRFIYNTDEQSQPKNAGAKLLAKRSVNSQKTHASKVVSRQVSSKDIAISIRHAGFSGLLASNKSAAKDILQQAVAQLNLSEGGLEEIEIAVANKKRQADFKEETRDESIFSYSDKLMTFFRELSGQSSENKIYVLKNLSANKLRILKQILNAHNITLRTFIAS